MSVPAAAAPPHARVVLLAVLAAGAGLLALFTPQLIVAYPADMPWYESPGLFPRIGLVLVLAGAAAELARRSMRADEGSEELDAAASRPRQMAAMLGLFLAYAALTPLLGFLSATLLFTAAAGAALRLRWRALLALAVGLSAVVWLLFVQVLQVPFGGWL